MVPQMQKSDGAGNQQGQALAYLLGVYFGDGCVPEGRKCFVVKSIDRDLIEYIREQYNVAFPGMECSINTEANQGYGAKLLHRFYGSSGMDFVNLTHKRQELPILAFSYPRPFIEGMLDSDGFAGLQATGSTIRFQVGMSKTTDIYHDVYKLICSLGIKCQKLQTQTLTSGKILKRIRFNPQSFLDSGLRFHTARKQDRVDAYRAMQASVSSNDYKRKAA